MSLCYEPSPNSGPLLQGEVLRNVWEHRPVFPATGAPEGTRINTRPLPTQPNGRDEPCLRSGMGLQGPFSELDQKERYDAQPNLDESAPALVNHILLCDVYTYKEIRPRIAGSHIWKRVQQNQDVRYHRFPVAPVGEPPATDPPPEQPKDSDSEDDLPPGFMPALFLDFKKTMTLPTSSLYEGLRNGGIERVLAVPPIYVHDLAQRFYSFMSRVGLPDA